MSDDLRLHELLQQWETRRRAGRPASPEDLCRDCPELLESLRERVEALRSLSLAPDVSPFAPTVDLRPTRAAEEAEPRAAADGPEMPSIPGYELLHLLGQGGMGVVWKARQRGLNRLVALKMILAGPYAQAAHLARFQVEVEAIARLQHPNIIQVYEVGELQGRPYFAMEYAAGGTLYDRVAGRPQPARQAAALIAVLARAMHAVHRHGIIHRDLKPANILLQPYEGSTDQQTSTCACLVGTEQFIPKITDFGLAKQTDSGAGPTLSGSIMGTPGYMAPEQAEGKSRDVGPGADVYALGAMLYDLLSGRPPFDAEGSWEVIRQVTTEDPKPLSRLRLGVPADLETICLKCLEKEPSRRYTSAADLADDLTRFLNGEPVKARPLGAAGRAWKWARRRPTAAALIVVSVGAVVTLAAVGLAYHIQLQGALRAVQAEAEQGRQQLVRLHVAQGSQLLDEGDWFSALPWFVEALRLDAGHPDREAVHRTRIAATLRQCPQPMQVWTHAGPVRCAAFSPDGRWTLTTGDDRAARVWQVASGDPAGPALEHGGPVRSGAFHPDGLLVATASADGSARVWDVATGQPQTPPLRHDGPVTCVSFSPDGRWVLTAGEDGTARLWNVATGAAVASPLRHTGPVRQAVFSHDGRHVLTVDEAARVWNVPTGDLVGLPLKHPLPVLHAAFDAKGQHVVTAGADGTARVWTIPRGDLAHTFAGHRGPLNDAAFSADGGLVITAAEDQQACVWGATTGELAGPALWHGSAINLAVFSPDGRRAVTASDDDSARVWDFTLGEPLTPLLRHNGSVNWAGFSPNGQFVLTVSNDHTARLWDVGSSLPALSPTGLPGPRAPNPRRWTSPDGRRVLTAEGDHSARVRDGRTNEPQGPLLEHGSDVIAAAFSPDGVRVVTASDDNTARVWQVETGTLLTPPLRHAGTIRQVAFSPDGRWVATVSGDRTARLWDAALGEPLTPPLQRPGGVASLAFRADGRAITLTGPGGSWTLSLEPNDAPITDLQSLAQLLSGSRVAGSLGLLPLPPHDLHATWQTIRSQVPRQFKRTEE